MRSLVCTGFLSLASLLPDHALAAVCDKVVGEHWRPGDGPAWTFPPFGELPKVVTHRPGMILLILLGMPLVFVLATFAVRAVSAGRGAFLAAVLLKWASYAAAALISIGAFFALHIIVVPDDIMVAAAREGCIILRTDWLGLSIEIGLVAGILLLYAWTAYRMRQFERGAEVRYRAVGS